VLPVTIVLGIAFPTASNLLRDRAEEAGTESGSLLAINTTGAILGGLLIPLVLMPLIGSPAIIVLLAAVNLAVAFGLALLARPRRLTTVAVGFIATAMVCVLLSTPGSVAQPTEAWIASVGGRLFDSSEDEIASVQAGQIRSTPELWVAGTSMTLQTVDAKLMPILPFIARPDSKRMLVVAFGMGTTFRSALIAGLKADVVELVPSVLDMFGYYYQDAQDFLDDPAGRVIIADGRNHLELSEERFDIIVTDPPPPIESSGASVISSKEYYEAGRDHLAHGGVMMQWVPYGAPEGEFKDHLRTFASVFPHLMAIRGTSPDDESRQERAERAKA
jgi:predicted membrane-bound spermidine synthase